MSGPESREIEALTTQNIVDFRNQIGKIGHAPPLDPGFRGNSGAGAGETELRRRFRGKSGRIGAFLRAYRAKTRRFRGSPYLKPALPYKAECIVN